MIHIFDNFFEDPFKIREIALKSNFEKDSNGEWPGFRSTSPLDLSLLIKNRLETKLNLSLKLSSSDFQFIPKCYLTGICHSDSPRKYSSICYLNPNSPKTSGTEIFLNKSLYLNIKEKLEIIDNGSVNKIKYYNSNKNLFFKIRYLNYLKKFNSNFKNPIIVSNKFNRMILFDSNLIHRAQNFYGKNVYDSRLTITTFFD